MCLTILYFLLTLSLPALSVRIIFSNASDPLSTKHILHRPQGGGAAIIIVESIHPDAAVFSSPRDAQCANAPTKFSSVIFTDLGSLLPGSVVTAYVGGRPAIQQLDLLLPLSASLGPGSAWRFAKGSIAMYLPLGCSGKPHERVIHADSQGRFQNTISFRTGEGGVPADSYFTGAMYVDSRLVWVRRSMQASMIWSIASTLILYRILIGRFLMRLVALGAEGAEGERGGVTQMVTMRACVEAFLHPKRRRRGALEEDEGVGTGEAGNEDVDDAAAAAAAEEPTMTTADASSAPTPTDQCPALGLDDVNPAPQPVHVFADYMSFGGNNNITLFREVRNDTDAHDMSAFHLNYTSGDGEWRVDLI